MYECSAGDELRLRDVDDNPNESAVDYGLARVDTAELSSRGHPPGAAVEDDSSGQRTARTAGSQIDRRFPRSLPGVTFGGRRWAGWPLLVAADVRRRASGVHVRAHDACPSWTRRRIPVRPSCAGIPGRGQARSEEHTSELQSLMRISYAV